MLLIPCRIKHPTSKKVVDAIFDADTGFAYVENGETTTVVVAHGVTFEVEHDLDEWFALLKGEEPAADE